MKQAKSNSQKRKRSSRPGASQKAPCLDCYYSDDNTLEAAVGPGAGMEFVKAYFPEAGDELLIATAYFSVRGYELARQYIPATTCIQVLVGKGDGHVVQKAVKEEIEFELGSVEPPNLYGAVEDLLNRLRSGRFRIADAREMIRRFHCKFYISHPGLAWHGSANFSLNGLKDQSEQTQIVRSLDKYGGGRTGISRLQRRRETCMKNSSSS